MVYIRLSLMGQLPNGRKASKSAKFYIMTTAFIEALLSQGIAFEIFNMARGVAA